MLKGFILNIAKLFQSNPKTKVNKTKLLTTIQIL